MKPMHITSSTDVTSNVTISIKDAENNDVADFFTITPIIKKVPAAIWGPYDPKTDPSFNPSQPSLLSTSSATIDQVTGFDLGPSTVTQSADIIELDIAQDCSEDVFASTPSKAPIIPSALSIPLSIPSPSDPNVQVPLNSSEDTRATQYSSCITQRQSWVPDFASDTLPQSQQLSNLKGKIAKMDIGMQDVLRSWTCFKGLSYVDTLKEGSTAARYVKMAVENCVMPLDVAVCAPFEENVCLPVPRMAVVGAA